MTEKLFYADPYLTEVQATVLSCEEHKKGYVVELDRSLFYPTGGGQPHDAGLLGNAQVLDVWEEDDRILHLCSEALPVGKAVSCKLDWDRRFELMQHHSGEHIVSGLVHARFGYDNVGFHMGSEVITIDFTGEVDHAAMREIEAAANAIVYRNIPTHIFYPDGETLKTLPYRSKKELTGQVRLVQFADIDLCACCGLHVAHSGEIGLIKLLSTTKFHNGSRLELLCGSKALAWLNTIADQNREISGLLSAKVDQTAAYVRKQAEELAQTKARCAQLETQLFTLKAQSVAGQKNVLLFEEALSPDSTRRLCDAVLQNCEGYCAVFSKKEEGWNYAIGSKEIDLRPMVKELNTTLNGRGGGKPNFVQGSATTDRPSIEAFFAHLP